MPARADVALDVAPVFSLLLRDPEGPLPLPSLRGAEAPKQSRCGCWVWRLPRPDKSRIVITRGARELARYFILGA